jgi:hypothetical protein
MYHAVIIILLTFSVLSLPAPGTCAATNPAPVPRFVDQGNGTVTDNRTGLVWTKDANAPGPADCQPADSRNWPRALDYLTCLNKHTYLGFTDWRLPTLQELRALADKSRSKPALPAGHPFVNVQFNFYWSASPFGENAGNAGIFGMTYGVAGNYNKRSGDFYVWPVRAGK